MDNVTLWCIVVPLLLLIAYLGLREPEESRGEPPAQSGPTRATQRGHASHKESAG
ncbi:MAG: hypothetical protein DIU80_014155 [Chloroflexota bacterium]